MIVMIILDIKTIIITIVFRGVKISVIIVFMIATNCPSAIYQLCHNHLYIKFGITIKIVIIIIIAIFISRTALFSLLLLKLPSITIYHHDII